MEMENVMIKNEFTEDCSIIEDDSVEIKSEFNEQIDFESINNKPYRCGICGHRTITDTLLKVHMKIHIVKRLHKCNICQKTFNFVTELNSHMITHSEEKTSFQCKLCNRDCFTIEDFQKHYRTHTKEKPIQCKLCLRHFTEYSYLRIHERSHHGEEYVKKNMMMDGTFVDPSLVENLNEESTSKVDNQLTMEKKMFKNNPNVPLNNEEKIFLLQYVERMGLHTKYAQVEQLKLNIRKCWVKIVKLFEKKNYDRTPDKLARTYFHMKNQAKTSIQRYHKSGKLPIPDRFNYMFVKLCPEDFDKPGINMQELQELSNKFRASLCEQDEVTSLSDEDTDCPVSPEYRSNDDLDNSIIVNSEVTTAQKRPNSQENSSSNPSKIQKITNSTDDPTKDLNGLKIKLLLADEQRKNHLYQIELKEKQELFTMDKLHRQEMYKREIQIKDMEIQLMKQKLEQTYNST